MTAVSSAALPRESLPHVRGGVSNIDGAKIPPVESSPRAWGCFGPVDPWRRDAVVFPTCVGVFPKEICSLSSHSRLPHVRGGVSAWRGHPSHQQLSSPRAWGCFRGGHCRCPWRGVFPTCVGVFLMFERIRRITGCLPHVRGGVSMEQPGKNTDEGSSPRAWGCFSGQLPRLA